MPPCMGQPIPPPPPDVPEPDMELHRFAFGFGLGASLAGFGTDRAECHGSACSASNVGARDYSPKVDVLLEGHAFYQATSFLRLGTTVMLSPSGKVEFKGVAPPTDAGFGTILNLDLAAELTPRLSRNIWLVPRLQSGLSMLFPTGELSQRLSATKDTCNGGNGAFKNCGSLDGPRYGLNVGVGVGALFAVSDAIGLRADTLFEYYSIRLATLDAGSRDANFVENASGGRFMLFGGMEF
jgi:hypothetical protein